MYEKVRVAVEGFHGALPWRLLTKAGVENVVITPWILQQDQDDQMVQKEHAILMLGKVGFEKKVAQAIDDIASLADRIRTLR
jgi:hypothetical protein